jgi:hypothetical protein
MTAIAMLAQTTNLYPKSSLLEKAGTISLITPKPGSIMM